MIVSSDVRRQTTDVRCRALQKERYVNVPIAVYV